MANTEEDDGLASDNADAAAEVWMAAASATSDWARSIAASRATFACAAASFPRCVARSACTRAIAFSSEAATAGDSEDGADAT